jgi:hypothetical protein
VTTFVVDSMPLRRSYSSSDINEAYPVDEFCVGLSSIDKTHLCANGFLEATRRGIQLCGMEKKVE